MLVSIATSQPGQITPIVEALVSYNDQQALDTLITIYRRAKPENRRRIVSSLASYGPYRLPANQYWKPLLEEVISSPDEEIRTTVMRLLHEVSVNTSREYLAKLLQDDSREVRHLAAAEVVRVAAFDWGIGEAGEDYGFGEESTFGLLAKAAQAAPAGDGEEAAEPGEKDNEPAKDGKSEGGADGSGLLGGLARMARAMTGEDAVALAQAGVPELQAVRQQHADWHDMLRGQVGPAADPRLILAYYVTGDALEGLELLPTVLKREDIADSLAPLDPADAVGVILKRLPWPGGRRIIADATANRSMIPLLARALEHARPEVQAMVHGSGILLHSLTDVREGDDLEPILTSLLADNGQRLLGDNPASGSSPVTALYESPNPIARAVAVLLACMRDGPDAGAIVAGALQDENVWVRRAACQGVIAVIEDHKEREKLLAPLLADPAPQVAGMAALGLLSDRIRAAAYLQQECNAFTYEGTTVQLDLVEQGYQRGAQGLLRTVPGKPAFLNKARALLAAEPTGEEPSRWREILALLLARYGDNSGLDLLFEEWKKNQETMSQLSLLAGLRLSRNPRYLPIVRSMMKEIREEHGLRDLLTPLRGVRGTEARELRREINQRIRGAR